MLWASLFNRLGKLQTRITGHQHVHLITQDPDTGREVITFLQLKFDTQGNPYFVPDSQTHENPHSPMKTHKTQNAKQIHTMPARLR